MLYTNLCGAALTHADEKRLARVIRGDDPVAAIQARNTLVLANLGLVHHILNLSNLQYISDYDDTISEGTLGLIRAAELYDPTRSNVRFSTYASVTIRWAMRQYLRHYRLPCVHIEDIEDMADDSPPVESLMVHAEQVEDMVSRIQGLPPLKRYIVFSRLGLDQSGQPRSFESLGAELGMSRAWVRLLFLSAKARLSVSFPRPDPPTSAPKRLTRRLKRARPRDPAARATVSA